MTHAYDPTSDRTASVDLAAAESPTPGQPRIAAFFDIDNTIIRGASAFHLGRELYRRDFFRLRDLITFGIHQARYLAFGENLNQIDDVQQRGLAIMQGHSVAEIVAIGEEVYDQVLALRIYPGTQALLDEHLASGHEVWLISATPVEIGSLIARHLGATGALGTVAEHRDGLYTGRLVGSLLHGQAKGAAVRHLAAERGIDLEQSFAYGDSLNDLALLQSVGNPCAINPDRRLRNFAAEAHWPTRDFRQRKVLNKRNVQRASLAGAVWAATLTVRSVVRRLRVPRG